jgi:hypothetical protein
MLFDGEQQGDTLPDKGFKLLQVKSATCPVLNPTATSFPSALVSIQTGLASIICHSRFLSPSLIIFPPASPM